MYHLVSFPAFPRIALSLTVRSSEMPLVRCPSDEERLCADTCRVAKKPYNEDEVIATYKRLIRSMPRANQYLLLYVLDLLSVFARKSDKNLMTAKSTSVPPTRPCGAAVLTGWRPPPPQIWR